MAGDIWIGDCVGDCMHCRHDMGTHISPEIYSIGTVFYWRWNFIFNYNNLFVIIYQNRDKRDRE